MNRRLFLKCSAAAISVGGASLAGCGRDTAKQATIEIVSHLGDLARLINDKRKAHQLPAIPLSSALTATAMWHCLDAENPQAQAWIQQKKGDLHSWSPYAPTNEQGQPLWTDVVNWTNGKSEKKATEIAGYPDAAFENSAWSSGQMTAEIAIELWMTSTKGHREVILNQGIWAGKTWRAIGAVFSQHYAFAWFGEKEA